MPKKTLADVDEQLAEMITLLSYYYMIKLSVASIGDLPLPSTYDHFIVSLFNTGSVAAKNTDKTTVNYIKTIIDGGKRKKASVITKHLDSKIQSLTKKFSKLSQTRKQMAAIITHQKVNAIKKVTKRLPKSEIKSVTKSLAKKHNISNFL